MTTFQCLMLDHAVALLSVAGWFTVGVAVALRRIRLGCWLMAVAVLLVIARVVTVALLAGHGWWFVREKVLLGLPLVCSAGLAAVLVAGPAMRRARRDANLLVPSRSLVVLLTAGYAALADLVVTFLVGYSLAWGTALITIALTLACVLLTARVIILGADDADHSARECRRLGCPTRTVAPPTHHGGRSRSRRSGGRFGSRADDGAEPHRQHRGRTHAVVTSGSVGGRPTGGNDPRPGWGSYADTC